MFLSLIWSIGCEQLFIFCMFTTLKCIDEFKNIQFDFLVSSFAFPNIICKGESASLQIKRDQYLTWVNWCPCWRQSTTICQICCGTWQVRGFCATVYCWPDCSGWGTGPADWWTLSGYPCSLPATPPWPYRWTFLFSVGRGCKKRKGWKKGCV